VAIFIQVFRLTHSSAAVGLVGLVALVPLTIGTIGGGAIVDAFDRRKLLLVTQVAFAAVSTALLLGALMGHPPLAFLYGAVAVNAILGGIDSPTRSAAVARLVGPEYLPSAVALNQVMWNASLVAGPALGGIVIERLGLSWAYGIDAVTYGATFITSAMLRPMPPEGDGERPIGFRAIREGFAYLKGRRVLQSTFAIDLIAMIFGMPRALFVVLAGSQFHRGAEVVGFLFSALGVGALLGALSAGWVAGIRHQGRAVIVAVAVWGLSIVGFGLSGPHLWLALTLLAIGGAADVISAVFRGTILQLSVPDSLRGRMNGIHILVVTGGPRIGDFEAGIVAAAFTPTISVVSGGVACLVGVSALIALAPQLWRYHAGSPA
jgi:MFS family permease